jgi:FtsP/CotA-like multicopper oxidase with cupredoxin domain
VIANDGNLLPHPVQVKSFRLGVAERVDIIVDFDALPNHPSVLYLENRLEQEDGRGPTNEILAAGAGDRLLEFRFGEPVRDDSVDPASQPTFYALPDKTEAPRVTRHFRWRGNGQWP